MTLYAIHHDWIDEHAMQGPVGIWDEDGGSYYPGITEHLKDRGHRASSRPKDRSWAGHLEYLTYSTSAYNANWSIVESDGTMQEVLDALQKEFLAEAHPVKHFVASDDFADTKEDSEVHKEDCEAPKEDSAETEASTDEPQFYPATRFVLAQTWWVASEFVRRHPDWAIRYGDHLSYLTLVNPRGDSPHAVCNPDTVHVFTGDSGHEIIRNLLSANDPHSVIKEMERLLGNAPRRGAPPSTPRSLAYRFLATALTATVNDRASWVVENEILGDDGLGDGPVLGGFVEQFPEAQRALAVTRSEAWDMGEPSRHFWAILREDNPVAIVSIEGVVYRPDHQIDLTTEYRRHDSRMLPVVTAALAELLP